MMFVRLNNISIRSVLLNILIQVNCKQKGFQVKLLESFTVNLNKYIRFIFTKSNNNVATIQETDNGGIVLKKQTRFMIRKLRRIGNENSSDIKIIDNDNKSQCTDKRSTKKYMAIFFGYNGAGYFGLQRQKTDIPTIELTLLKVLLEVKYISEAEFADSKLLNYRTTSRTDTGVSAARQLISLKLPKEAKKEEVNLNLPLNIRIFSIKKVNNDFNPQNDCTCRTYSYNLPTYVFEPQLPYASISERKAYRLSAEKHTNVNEVLENYKGTRRYHNFTRNKFFEQQSSLRTYHFFRIHRIFIESEMEFAEIQVQGQSFMLHQIRKMIGLMIAIIRGHTDYSTMDKAFTDAEVKLAKAPGLGLVLEKVHFEKYNRFYKKTRTPIVWDEMEDVVQEFKENVIYPSIVKGEIEDDSMGRWVRERLNGHCYEAPPVQEYHQP